jgi:hypothetical protein
MQPTPLRRVLLWEANTRETNQEIRPPLLYRTRRFVVAFTRACHSLLSPNIWIQSTPWYYIPSRSILILFSVPGLVFQVISSSQVYVWLHHIIPQMRITCSICLVLLDLITLAVLDEVYKLWIPSLRKFSSLFILLMFKYSQHRLRKIHSLCSSHRIIY